MFLFQICIKFNRKSSSLLAVHSWYYPYFFVEPRLCCPNSVVSHQEIHCNIRGLITLQVTNLLFVVFLIDCLPFAINLSMFQYASQNSCTYQMFPNTFFYFCWWRYILPSYKWCSILSFHYISCNFFPFSAINIVSPAYLILSLPNKYEPYRSYIMTIKDGILCLMLLKFYS